MRTFKPLLIIITDVNCSFAQNDGIVKGLGMHVFPNDN